MRWRTLAPPLDATAREVNEGEFEDVRDRLGGKARGEGLLELIHRRVVWAKTRVERLNSVAFGCGLRCAF